MSEQSKVREVLTAAKVCPDKVYDKLCGGCKSRIADAEQVLYDAMLEVIGKNENEDMYRCDEFVSDERRAHYEPIIARNDLRSEQRQKLNALFGRDDGGKSV